MEPSMICPENGSTFHDAASAVTTSMWLNRIIGRFEPFPFNRAMMFARVGLYSKISFGMPFWSKIDLKNLAVSISLPGGFDVLMRRYCCIKSPAMSGYLGQSIGEPF